MADDQVRYFLADGDELTEFAIVNVGVGMPINGHAAVSIANVGVAMVDNFGLGGGGE
jgi:hypothetical protein